MAIKDNDESFTVDITGSTTGEQFKGTFKAKKWLSLEDELIRDNKRRELLGPAPGAVPPRIGNMATVLSELFVRITEAPSWWGEDGRTLKDDEPASEIYKKALEISEKAISEVKNKGKEAKKDLESIPEDPEA